ncbi:methyl-accepting chemotaxis protein [Paramagnetospirillum caucaseum]|uniref:Methyl-accepting chemotaxis protein n=1 Tax=Paramagnetospirillum caucaseum TaxID=1244869 RepID=M3A4T1_9PROT|nr:MCP four helix bundle domain-containing protein [Paramagnetospirillum caucaseum]EME67858.1 methyl-accepting chemotaxis protein [Paramagnetospirillum caucaseum]
MKALLNFVERFKLTTKLVIGFSSGILVAVLIGLQAQSNLSHMQGEMEKMYEMELLGISHIKEANVNLAYMGRALRQMMIAPDGQSRDRARAHVDQARSALHDEMAQARKRLFRAEAIEGLEKFQRNLARYNENVEHAMGLIERESLNPSAAAKFVASAEFIASGNAADEDLDRIVKVKERGTRSALELVRADVAATQRMAVGLLLGGILAAILLGVLIGLSIQRPNERLRNSVEELAAGNVEAQIPHTDYPNEIGIMARAIGVLQDIYRKANDQHWVKSHVSDIGAALQQAEDFAALARIAVSKIAPAIGAGHGAFYVADGEGRYNLLAGYGYRERKHLSNSFAVGEGLVGQCVMEKSTIVLTAPKDYIRIGSGLGEGPPASIIVLPVIHDDRVLGVLEMASFQPFKDREQAVLEALLPTLSTGMEILDRNLRTRELLAATQEQAERMEKQAAQLEEQQVEMEAQQAELLETENWFRSIIETAPDGMLVADSGGRILLANPNAEGLFGYSPGELIGGDVEQVMPGHHAMDSGHEVKGRHKDGTTFPIALSTSPLPPRGGRGKCLSISVRARQAA